MNNVTESGHLPPSLLFAFGLLIGVNVVIAWLIFR
jgi:hypothetical protein